MSGDGRNDLVVVNSKDDNLVIYLQSTSGRISEDDRLDTGEKPVDLAIQDLNGDGANDIVVVNRDDSSVMVFWQGLEDVWEVWSHDLEEGVEPFAVAAGDINGDGRGDFVVANRKPDEQGDFTVVVFVSDPTMTRPSLIKELKSGLTSPLALAIGDVSSDGLQDLVVADSTGVGGAIRIYLQAQGTHLLPAEASLVLFPIKPSRAGIALADVDDDGRNDIIASSDNLEIFLQNARGGFPSERSFDLETETNPASVAIGHLDHDGLLDVVATNSRPIHTFHLYLQKRVDSISTREHGRSFNRSPTRTYASDDHPMTFSAIGDLNGDGRNDLVMGSTDDDVLILFLAR